MLGAVQSKKSNTGSKTAWYMVLRLVLSQSPYDGAAGQRGTRASAGTTQVFTHKRKVDFLDTVKEQKGRRYFH